MKAKYDIGSILLSCSLAVFGFLAWSYADNFSSLGAIFPKTFSIVLIVCSLGYIILSLAKGKNRKKKTEAGELWRGLLLFMVLLLWCLLFDKFGFIVSSVGCYVILAVLADHNNRQTPRRLVSHCVLGIAISGLFYLIFSQVLGVPLPKGILPL